MVQPLCSPTESVKYVKELGIVDWELGFPGWTEVWTYFPYLLSIFVSEERISKRKNRARVAECFSKLLACLTREILAPEGAAMPI